MDDDDGAARLMADAHRGPNYDPDREPALLQEIATLRRERDEAREKVTMLRRQVTIAREGAERRNKQLRALSFVACSGGCTGGMRDGVTADDVAFLYLNAARAESWYINNAGNGLPGTVEARRPAWEWAREKVAAALVLLGDVSGRVEVEAERDEARERLAAMDAQAVEVCELMASRGWVCGGATIVHSLRIVLDLVDRQRASNAEAQALAGRLADALEDARKHVDHRPHDPGSYEAPEPLPITKRINATLASIPPSLRRPAGPEEP